MGVPTADELVTAARRGGVRATARLLTLVESVHPGPAEVARALAGLDRSAAIIGITGAPGAGKSTLTGALLRVLRERGRTVAVLAVDPASPFSGGALLGDRVRMSEFATDSGVFIRSMSTRGHLGGLSAAAPAAVDLLSAIGFDVVVIETVGVGQSEVDVMRLADSVAVVVAPGMGDGIQAAKAGILEIADLLVVNKADHEGTAQAVRDLRSMVALGRAGHAVPGQWRIPVLTTVATDGSGVPALADMLAEHRGFCSANGELAERGRRRALAAVEGVVLGRVRTALNSPAGRDRLAAAAAQVADGRTDHHTAASGVLRWLRGDDDEPAAPVAGSGEIPRGAAHLGQQR